MCHKIRNKLHLVKFVVLQNATWDVMLKFPGETVQKRMYQWFTNLPIRLLCCRNRKHWNVSKIDNIHFRFCATMLSILKTFASKSKEKFCRYLKHFNVYEFDNTMIPDLLTRFLSVCSQLISCVRLGMWMCAPKIWTQLSQYTRIKIM